MTPKEKAIDRVMINEIWQTAFLFSLIFMGIMLLIIFVHPLWGLMFLFLNGKYDEGIKKKYCEEK